MPFHTADYDVYVALGDPDTPPLWCWQVWQRFLPSIDPLVQAGRGKPAVRSSQCLLNPGTDAKPGRVVKFGKLGWKASDHQKWAHGSPANAQESKAWSFLTLEVWAPAWTACEREHRAPDVFLSVSDESLGGFRQELLFNPVIILATESELAQRKQSEVASVVSALLEIASAKLVGHQRRPWGRSFGSVGFSNSIQDLGISGLFKPGPRHKGEIGLHLLAEQWQSVSPEGAAPQN